MAGTALVGGCQEAKLAAATTLTVYSMKTAWHPIPDIGDWPLDHVAVTASSGTQWGCFGRTQAEEPANSKAIAQGAGDAMWAAEIAGPDGHSGIEFGVTGICHHCANRITAPANIDARRSPGNEIATPIFGRFGLGRPALVQRIKDAAKRVNAAHPRRISDAAVAAVVKRVSGGLKDEWEIVNEDFEQYLKPALKDEYETFKGDIEHVYLGLYHHREALFAAYSRGTIDKARFVARMNSGFTASLEDLKDVLGPERFGRIVPIPIKVAADYVFYQLPPAYQ
ncbi:hypothetical protein [Caulobacter segnis]|uniref:hypothetical protein n=1 Tax=Caulobacter segnis TaxID=88688 RepID=UPI001CBD6F17|nr:hypothetical protein [Caulobacter segnis]UAL10106.1 hypothetical protein K8940_20425 [Caulobacter segnis]